MWRHRLTAPVRDTDWAAGVAAVNGAREQGRPATASAWRRADCRRSRFGRLDGLVNGLVACRCDLLAAFLMQWPRGALTFLRAVHGRPASGALERSTFNLARVALRKTGRLAEVRSGVVQTCRLLDVCPFEFYETLSGRAARPYLVVERELGTTIALKGI